MGIIEDNTPPSHVTGVSASFQGFSNGTGTTTKIGDETSGESNEVYQVGSQPYILTTLQTKELGKIADVLESGLQRVVLLMHFQLER